MRNVSILSVSMLLLASASFAAESNVQPVPAFMHGLNAAHVIACEKKYQNACPLARQNDGAALHEQDECINKKLANDKACEQASAIRAVAFYPANHIKKYGQVSVFNVTTLADGVDVFHMVDIKGNFISLTTDVDLDRNKTYQEIIKQYPKAELTTLLYWKKQQARLFPQVKAVSGGDQLIFTQTLRDGGCVACATVGVAEVAYLFSATGVYQCVKVVSVRAVKA